MGAKSSVRISADKAEICVDVLGIVRVVGQGDLLGCTCDAGLPFVILNTLCGAYTIYGLAGLRYEWHGILLYGVMITLQSIIAIQLMIFCVYLTPNQVTTPFDTLWAKHGKPVS